MALTVALHTHCAAALAAALARCPEAVCRRYLPHGRRQGRYWVAGDLGGARGRSLYVRLRPGGPPGKWTDAATGEHGDLLDLIRHRIGAGTLGPALDEARAFLALPVVVRRDPEAARADPPASWDGAAACGAPATPSAAPRRKPTSAPGGAGATLLVGEGIETVLSLVAAVPTLHAATVLTPVHGDFNDDLAALGPRALAARLAPLLGPGTGS